MATISVIVPIYNVEKYLPICLESILAQSYTDYEVILVNDGSPDNSETICLEYVKKYPRFKYVTKKNGGLSSARNTGIEKSTSPYLFFVDSDDYLPPDALLNLVQPLKTYPNLDLIIGGYNSIDEQTNLIKGFTPGEELTYFNNTDPQGHKALINKIFTDNMLREVVWNKLYHRRLFTKFKYPHRIYEDTFICPELYTTAKEIAFIPEIVYNYLVNRIGSITASAKNPLLSVDTSFFCFYKFWLYNPDSPIINIKLYRILKDLLRKLKQPDIWPDNFSDSDKVILRQQIINIMHSLPKSKLPLAKRLSIIFKYRK